MKCCPNSLVLLAMLFAVHANWGVLVLGSAPISCLALGGGRLRNELENALVERLLAGKEYCDSVCGMIERMPSYPFQREYALAGFVKRWS